MDTKKIEIERKISHCLSYMFFLLILFIITFLVLWTKSMINDDIYSTVTIVAIVMLIFCFVLKYMLIKDIFYKIKMNYVEKKLKDKFDDLSFQNICISHNEKMLKLLELNNENSYNNPFRRRTEQCDFLSGSYMNINFIQYTLKTIGLRTTIFVNLGTLTNTLFNGTITEIYLDFTSSPVFISTKNMKKAYILTYKIKTGNEKFDKKFNVTCDNKKEALKLLNENMINKIMLLMDNLLSNKVFILFYDNKICIGQNGLRAFEPNLKVKINKKSIDEMIINHSKCINKAIKIFSDDDKQHN